MAPLTLYKNDQLSKLNVFYQEAEDKRKLTILLLHEFPTSSHQFHNLIPLLADDVHLVAPNLPRFGNTESLVNGSFNYTFNNLALISEELVEHLGLEKYYIYVFDYGMPTSFHLVLAHPKHVLGFIVQNGNAYEEGLTPFWDPIQALWKDHTPKMEKALLPLFALKTTKYQYTKGAQDL